MLLIDPLPGSLAEFVTLPLAQTANHCAEASICPGEPSWSCFCSCFFLHFFCCCFELGGLPGYLIPSDCPERSLCARSVHSSMDFCPHHSSETVVEVSTDAPLPSSDGPRAASAQLTLLHTSGSSTDFCDVTCSWFSSHFTSSPVTRLSWTLLFFPTTKCWHA